MLNNIDLFVTTVNHFKAVFSPNYEAGDFCKGLYFGKDGAQMLTKVAHSMVAEEDEI